MNPCKDLCYQRYGKQYSKECDKECDFAKAVKRSKKNDVRTDEELGSAYAYCEDCRLVEVCRYYPYDGCDFKEVAKSEWISPKKRLPNEYDRVLVTIQINKREPVARSGYFASGAFSNDNGDYWRAEETEVIAWMPLPKPYRED